MTNIITDAQIRRVAERIRMREGVSQQEALQRAAKWAAKKMLAENNPGRVRHNRSLRCPCNACAAWRARLDEKRKRNASAYSSSSGGW